MRLFVANLNWNLTEKEMNDFFAPYGGQNCQILMDRETSRSRGFGFVEFASEREANNAVAQLNGTVLMGRPIDIKPAHPKTQEDRPPRSDQGSKSKRVFQPPTRDGNRKEYIPDNRGNRRGRDRD